MDKKDRRNLGDVIQDSTLETLSDLPNYQNWLASLAEQFLGDDPLEIGSGNGDYADIWIQHGFNVLTLNEADDTRLSQLREKFSSNSKIKILNLNELALSSKKHSSCSSFNVLEHVDDDTGFIEKMSNWVIDGGYVFILVPAFPFAYSNFDHQIGHYRRYTKKSLSKAMESAGLKSISVHYINPLGLIAWFVMMKCFGRSPRSGIAIELWDKLVIPLTRRIEKHLRMPIGQSCIGVGIVRQDRTS